MHSVNQAQLKGGRTRASLLVQYFLTSRYSTCLVFATISASHLRWIVVVIRSRLAAVYFPNLIQIARTGPNGFLLLRPKLTGEGLDNTSGLVTAQPPRLMERFTQICPLRVELNGPHPRQATIRPLVCEYWSVNGFLDITRVGRLRILGILR
jgi:hypothetical protein